MSLAEPRLRLDRMTIEEAGPDPVRLADAIHRQVSVGEGPVPIHAIAAALDIVEIREAVTRSFEGALIMPDDRNVGAILVNAASSRRRQRFTIAHELGHFLSIHHQPTSREGFSCTKLDLGSGWSPGPSKLDRHATQESEANRFAIELLAPASLMRRALKGIPDLAKVVACADSLDLSREATARRYMQLHPEPLAVLFSRDGRLRYLDRAKEFPYLALANGDPLPSLPAPDDADGVSAHEEGDPTDWFGGRASPSVVVQTLHQESGFAITLLAIERDDDGGET